MLDLWSPSSRPVIGMLHAPPLPGSPRWGGDLDAVRTHVLRDAESLTTGGVDGLILENFGDAPFFPGRVPVETVAHLTALASAVRGAVDLPLGINVLRNDGESAVAIAHAVGAAFVRINVLCGAAVTDQGLIQGVAHDVLRLRKSLGATHVKIMADVRVKHAAPLAQRPIADEVADLIHRGAADAVIVSGSATGHAVDLEQLKAVKAAAGQTPVFVGSGVMRESITSLAAHADGFIVGSSLKRGGRVNEPIDVERVKSLMAAI